MQKIHVVRTPAGAGPEDARRIWVGHVLPLAPPKRLAELHLEFPHLKDLPEAYEVEFRAALEALALGPYRYWVDYLRRIVPPRLLRFPKDCAELTGHT